MCVDNAALNLWAAHVNRYNNGGSVEWYERNDEYPDYEEFSADVAFSYTDED